MNEELRRWLNGLKAMRNGLPEFNKRMADTLGSTAIEEVNNRIVEKGEDSTGKPLQNAKNGKDYSDTELPVSVFYDQTIPLPKEKAKRMEPFISYKDYKQAIGRYRGKRDFMLTGRMWANTGLTEARGDATSFHATVKGRNEETQRKLDRNSTTSGVDILDLSAQEEENLAKDFDVELQLYVDGHLP